MSMKKEVATDRNPSPAEEETKTDHDKEDISSITTYIYNPGIAGRLEQDVMGFESYGFSFEGTNNNDDTTTSTNDRHVDEDDDPAAMKDGTMKYGTLTWTRPLTSSLNNTKFNDNQMNIFVSPTRMILLKMILQDNNLISSIGPFLRTLVRLSVDPINPRSLHTIVVCASRPETTTNDNNNNNKEEEEEALTKSKQKKNKKKKNKKKDSPTNNNKKQKKRMTDSYSPRFLAHGIHMMIRNSMGAGLFTCIHVVLPKNVTISSVESFMKQNDDGCYEYPSVQLYEQEMSTSNDENNSDNNDDENAPQTSSLSSSIPFHSNTSIDATNYTDYLIDLGLELPSNNDSTSNQKGKRRGGGGIPKVTKPISYTCLQDYDPSRHVLSVSVQTRMCTVRLTPLLYHLANRLLRFAKASIKSPQTLLEMKSVQEHNQEQKQKQSLVLGTTVPPPKRISMMICLEKLSNVYRVLMLARDYITTDEDTNASGWDFSNFIIVVKTEPEVAHFDQKAKAFLNQNFGIPLDNDITATTTTPKVITVETAAQILEEQNRLQTSQPCKIVAIDLHPQAWTLGQQNNNDDNDDNDWMKDLLRFSSDDPNLHVTAIWGFESDGIPQSMDEHMTDYVQILSRTSINVVAAVSMLLHILYSVYTV